MFSTEKIYGVKGGGVLLTEILRVIDVYHLCLYVSLNNNYISLLYTDLQL